MTHPYPKGTRVQKYNSKPEDLHENGAKGTVVDVLGPVPDGDMQGRCGYFILWDDFPLPVFIADDRVRMLGN
jgi:hypothetical protein